MLVDDEPLALRDLSRQLIFIGDIEIAAALDNPEDAAAAAAKISPDVIFLDIDMPILNGIAVAEAIYPLLPEAEIVFVTAFDDYAVKAFELNAVDYLLKPFSQKRLKLTIDKLRERRRLRAALPKPAEELPQEAKVPLLRCFKHMEFETGRSGTVRWRTLKAQELFAYLLLHKDRQIRKDLLVDLLWPDMEYKKGYTHLYTAIYQIRQTLGSAGIPFRLNSSENGYKLELDEVSLDTELWERGIFEAPPLSGTTVGLHINLVKLYRDDYLCDYDYVWAEGERERLRLKWLEHTRNLARFLADEGRLSEAIALYSRIAVKFPHLEDVHFDIMKLYRQTGHEFAVENQYLKLVAEMSDETGREPRAEIRDFLSLGKRTQPE
ncbi:response regulator [Paenibacillus sp. sptzw28]|uniref:response regulator n=1 Tax=Paenibacillus sp. sptzw28 TaxID=715179 RepID=UPI002162F264|nr:response regulator [Paenibacillus sp. sptzw28]